MMSLDLYCFFVGVSLVVVFSAPGECAAEITLRPINPTGTVGEDMRLNCTLSDKTHHSQNFSFSISYYTNETSRRHPLTHIRRWSSWGAEVTVRNLTDSHHYANVFCCYGKELQAVQIITVGRPPDVPIIDYHRYLDWRKFVFRWTIPNPANGFPTTYMGWFKTSKQPDYTPCSMNYAGNCPSSTPDGNTCIVNETVLDSSHDGYISIKVNGSNVAGSSSTERNYFYQDYIEPGKVTLVKVSSYLKLDVGRFVDVVSFQPQKEYNLFNFEVRTKSLEHPGKNQSKIYQNVRSGERIDERRKIALTDLHLNPFTLYRLRIRSKVVVAGENQGFWSEWVNVTFTSHEEVPLVPPSVCQCCFEVDEEDSYNRTAFIYFTPLTKAEARGKVSYDLVFAPTTILNPWSQLNITGVYNEVNKTQLTFNNYSMGERKLRLQRNNSRTAVFKLGLLKSVQYKMNVNAVTSAGQAQEKSTTVIIPSQSELLGLQPPANCSVMSVQSVDGNDENRIVFRWNKTTSVGGVSLKSVTVFWCKAFLNSRRCQQPLNWIELYPEETSVMTSLKESYEEYLFGIGLVLVNDFSSGIHWTCSYFTKNAVASPPLLFPLEIDETWVVIKLEKPNYNPREGLVYGYNVYYSYVDDEGQQKESRTYVGDLSNRLPEKIEGLRRGTSYTFKAQSLTAAGPSFANTSVNVATIKKPFQLTGHALGVTIVAAVVVGILAIIGFTCCIRWPHEKISRWIKFEPRMPSVILGGHDQKQKNFSDPGYALVSESAALNNALNQIEDDQIEPYGSYRQTEDVVQAYSRITPRHETTDRMKRLSTVGIDELHIGFSQSTHAVSMPEHVLPLLEQPPEISIQQQQLTHLAQTSEQSDQSTNRTPVSTDNDQSSSSNCYIAIGTVGEDMESLPSNEQTKTSPISQQNMVGLALAAEDGMLIYSEILNDVLSQNLELSMNSQTANESMKHCFLSLPNETVNQDRTFQILPATDQQVRHSALSELSQNTDESIMAELILPTPSQRMNLNVMDTSRSRPLAGERVLQPPVRTTGDGSEFDGPSVVMLSNQSMTISDQPNAIEQIDPFSHRVNDEHGIAPSNERILPKLIDNGFDLMPFIGFNNLAKLQTKRTQMEQRHDDRTSALVRGRTEQTEQVMGNGNSSSSSSSSSSSADETSSKSEDDVGSRQARPCAPSSLEDDEGIYL